jgi:hypothetical protein
MQPAEVTSKYSSFTQLLDIRPRASHQSQSFLPTFKVFQDFQFPPKDLLSSLIDNYFRCYNDYLPLLHRPTFDRAVANGQHLEDDSFGAIVILVSAIGSSHSDDPRLRVELNQPDSAGWNLFKQLHLDELALMNATPLYAVQICVVSHSFASIVRCHLM